MNCMKIFRKTFHLVAIDISPSNIVQELLWPPFLFLNKKQPNTENSNYPWNTKLSYSVIKYSVWFHFFTPRVNYGDMNVIQSFQIKPFWQYFSMAPFFSQYFTNFSWISRARTSELFRMRIIEILLSPYHVRPTLILEISGWPFQVMRN